MLRYVHRTGVGVVAWRQSSGAAVTTTCAPKDGHRRTVSRGRVVRGVAGYGVITGAGNATGTPASITLTAPTGTANTSGGSAGNAFGSFMAVVLTPATGLGTGKAAAMCALPAITLVAATGAATSGALQVSGARAGGPGSRNTTRPSRIANTTR